MNKLETRSRILFVLAILVLAAGAASSLLIRHLRSSSTREVMDVAAAGENALAILENTASLAGRWREPGGGADALDIALQECLALLESERERARALEEQLQLRVGEVDGAPEAAEGEDILAGLALLGEAQEALAAALSGAREAMGGLRPLHEGEASYAEARGALADAIAAHNQALGSSPPDLSPARLHAEAAADALQRARAAVESVSAEGMDTGAALAAISGLAGAAQDFIQACVKGEAGDAASHNQLMDRVRSSLDASPSSLAETLSVTGWLASLLAPRLEELEGKLAEARARIRRT
ncbi:MAG: hypothetical protein QME88_04675 [Actinomycetota bacterium]|nr:hypothetical protein [Actinomycetota bacterium]